MIPGQGTKSSQAERKKERGGEGGRKEGRKKERKTEETGEKGPREDPREPERAGPVDIRQQHQPESPYTFIRSHLPIWPPPSPQRP